LTTEDNGRIGSGFPPGGGPRYEGTKGNGGSDRDMSRSASGKRPADGRNEPVVVLENVTLRLRDRFLLDGTSWRIYPGEHWAVLGPNGAGKSTLVGAIAGRVSHVRGKITGRNGSTCPNGIGYVSFELQDFLMGQAEWREAADAFAGKTGKGYRAGEAILSGLSQDEMDREAFRRIDRIFGIENLLDRGFTGLSTGETRKIIIARALLKSPRILVLDEPFAGLDAPSKEKLRQVVEALAEEGTQVILVTHRREEILPFISHVIGVREGRVTFQGTRRAALSPRNLDRLFGGGRREFSPAAASPEKAPFRDKTGPVLVEMKGVSVRYGAVQVLRNVHWTVRAGENWAVLGPNGSGKSTLMSLISADNLQAYSNDITLFGRRRGTGEAAADIRARIGVVSSELQGRYRREDTAFHVVASGLFDSIGLYRNLSPEEKKKVRDQIYRFRIGDIAGRPFAHLSYGERRMVLLARALVKPPELLILDEPCQGLDGPNRRALLDLIDETGRRGETTLLYVTHFEDEIPRSIDRVLRLGGPLDSTATVSFR